MYETLLFLCLFKGVKIRIFFHKFKMFLTVNKEARIYFPESRKKNRRKRGVFQQSDPDLEKWSIARIWTGSNDAEKNLYKGDTSIIGASPDSPRLLNFFIDMWSQEKKGWGVWNKMYVGIALKHYIRST